ncbi:arabinosidase [Pyronema omphalodes]|nr:arabinosidase [Pyronema omphalodes]
MQLSRYPKPAFSILLLLGILALLPSTIAAVISLPPRYIFTTFTWSSESNLFVYTSSDGLHFSLLKGPSYTCPLYSIFAYLFSPSNTKIPSGTLMRDPSPLKHIDGFYYLSYTTSWTGREFGIARSSDLLNWKLHTRVPIMTQGTDRTWAPEFFRDETDGSVNIIVSLGKGLHAFRPYVLTARDSSLLDWQEPRELSGIGENYIDTFLIQKDGKYHAFAKNEDTKFVEHAVADHTLGPYHFVQTENFANWGHIEGPCVTKAPDGGYRLYADAYEGSVRKYYYMESRDLYNWTGAMELPNGLSGFVRHGTVYKNY